MPPPVFFGAGTVAAGLAAVAPALPVGWQPGHLHIIFCETAEQTANVPALPAGWAYLNSVQVPIAGTQATKLTAMWRRAVGGDTAPTIADPGDHIIARMLGFTGVTTVGNPWNTTATSTEAVADTSASWPTVTTTVADCLVLHAIATGQDILSTANMSAFANASLTGVAEYIDNWTDQGNGGGIGVFGGVKTTAGLVSAGTATVGLATNNFKALATIALAPVVAAAGPPILAMAPL